MNYIGITGHRGSGKTSIGYLIGNTIDSIMRGYSKDEISDYFKEWCETIKKNNNAIYDCCLDYVYFDEFGEMPKSFVAQLLSIDMSVLDSDTLKDRMYVNMRDFKLYTYDKSFKVLTAKELEEYTKANSPKKWKDIYISLRHFMAYFSVNIMQKLFGADVWLKTRLTNDSKYGEVENGYKIFSDVKLKDEINYIKDKGGVLIKTIRPSHKKSNKGITNIEDVDSNYTVNTEGELIDLFEMVYNLSKEIYDNGNKY